MRCITIDIDGRLCNANVALKHHQHLRGAYRRDAQFTQRSYTSKEQG
jgi:hypothetical protein